MKLFNLKDQQANMVRKMFCLPKNDPCLIFFLFSSILIRNGHLKLIFDRKRAFISIDNYYSYKKWGWTCWCFYYCYICCVLVFTAARTKLLKKNARVPLLLFFWVWLYTHQLALGLDMCFVWISTKNMEF